MKNNSWLFYSVLAGLVTVGGFFVWRLQLSQKALAYFEPQPENFTELYFDDHLDLPRNASPGAGLAFSYTIHNVEHATTSYPTQITVNEDPDLIATPSTTTISSNNYNLTSDETQSIPVQFIMPPSRTMRAEITIELTNLNQTIHFWVGIPPQATVSALLSNPVIQ